MTIVTTRAADGTPAGLTVNSFNSVSLEPPLVLWSLSLKASSLDAFRDCRYYAVNVLAAGQLDAAKTFADAKADRFAQVRVARGAVRRAGDRRRGRFADRRRTAASTSRATT